MSERHAFKPSYTGRVCEAMVIRDGGGDACGEPADSPVHSHTPHKPTGDAYEAVYAYIRQLRETLPESPVQRNAMIWRAVSAALAAAEAAGGKSPCPTCSWPSRETVDMVCQTCGWDYTKGEKPELVDKYEDQSAEGDGYLDALLAEYERLFPEGKAAEKIRAAVAKAADGRTPDDLRKRLEAIADDWSAAAPDTPCYGLYRAVVHALSATDKGAADDVSR